MKYTNTIEIRNTADKVFYWLEDPSRAVAWMTSVSKTEIVDETPNMVGTTFRETVEENGRGTEMKGVVTGFVSNKHLAFHLEGEFNSVDVDYTLQEEGRITHLTQTADVRFKGLLRLLSVFLGPILKKKIEEQARGEFDKLKKLCEQHR